MQNAVLIALVVIVVIFLVHQYNPYFFSSIFSEGFADAADKSKADADKKKAETDKKAAADKKAAEDKKAADKKAADEKAKAKTVSKFQDMHDEEKKESEGFADLNAAQGPAQFGSFDQPAGCYPRDQLTPSELLPKDNNSVWAEQNPMGPGSLKGKNFLSAGALIGVNTVGQSMRNANLQIRSEPPNPQVAVSIFNQSTITPDVSHRSLEIA